MTERTVAITGASGMLGSRLCDDFLARGYTVRALVRDPASFDRTDTEIERFELPNEIHPESLEGASLLVHCAATTRARDLAGADDVDETGSQRLFELARETGTERIVFLSSVSAHEDARSRYGKSKRAIETLLDPGRDIALRLGLVLSRGGGGLFERMVGWVRGMRFIPVFGGGHQPVQPIHVDDVCRALELALERDVTGTLVLGAPSPITLRELLEEIARRLDRKPRLVSVPFAPVKLLLRGTEALRVPLPISSENLAGLEMQRFMPSQDDLDRLGLELRPLADSLDAVLR